MPEKYAQINKILEKVENRFLLCVASAKRARQLKEGATKLIEGELVDEEFLPLEVALKELEEDKLKIIVKENNDDDDDLLDEIHQYIDVDVEKKEEEPKNKKESKSSKSKSKSLAA